MIESGSQIPELYLTSLTGEPRNLDSLSNGAPLLLAIYKSSCPVCQLTLPFLDRINRGSLRVVAVSQDDLPDTMRFIEKYQLNLPVLLDRAKDRYPVSNAFGITSVPSLFLVEPGRTVSLAVTGFRKSEIEDLGKRSGVQAFKPDEPVPEWKAG
jgi:peroxiredoxin